MALLGGAPISPAKHAGTRWYGVGNIFCSGLGMGGGEETDFILSFWSPHKSKIKSFWAGAGSLPAPPSPAPAQTDLSLGVWVPQKAKIKS